MKGRKIVRKGLRNEFKCEVYITGMIFQKHKIVIKMYCKVRALICILKYRNCLLWEDLK